MYLNPYVHIEFKLQSEKAHKKRFFKRVELLKLNWKCFLITWNQFSFLSRGWRLKNRNKLSFKRWLCMPLRKISGCCDENKILGRFLCDDFMMTQILMFKNYWEFTRKVKNYLKQHFNSLNAIFSLFEIGKKLYMR